VQEPGRREEGKRRKEERKEGEGKREKEIGGKREKKKEREGEVPAPIAAVTAAGRPRAGERAAWRKKRGCVGVDCGKRSRAVVGRG
jgi:hypothetical protein